MDIQIEEKNDTNCLSAVKITRKFASLSIGKWSYFRRFFVSFCLKQIIINDTVNGWLWCVNKQSALNTFELEQLTIRPDAHNFLLFSLCAVCPFVAPFYKTELFLWMYVAFLPTFSISQCQPNLVPKRKTKKRKRKGRKAKIIKTNMFHISHNAVRMDVYMCTCFFSNVTCTHFYLVLLFHPFSLHLH